MSKLVMLLVCGVVSFIMFMACLINGVRWAIGVFAHRDCANTVRAFKKSGFALLGILLFMGIFVITTQLLASTPTIKDSNGKIVEGSIASLTSVKLNGHKEWITIRGYDKEAPVLLFLAGGPGGTQMAATRYELGELEKHFVVVSWDQPGSGKSYNCMNRSDITVETYIEDGIALTEYLLKTFEKKKFI